MFCLNTESLGIKTDFYVLRNIYMFKETVPRAKIPSEITACFML